MYLLPFSTFQVQTDLPLETVVERAFAHIRPRSLFDNPFRARSHPFEGSVSREGFRVTPVTKWYERQTSSVARGRFVQTPTGVRVEVRLGVRWTLWVLLGLLLAFVLLGIGSRAMGESVRSQALLGPVFLGFFLYGTTLMRFRREEGPARKAIEAWFVAPVHRDDPFHRPPPIG